MDSIAVRRRSGRFSSYGRPLAIIFAIVAVISPLYIDRTPDSELEDDDEPLSLASLLPVLMLVMILAIALTCYLDQSYTRFDPYWIHRVGGSSGGIILILTVLVLVLRCKS